MRGKNRNYGEKNQSIYNIYSMQTSFFNFHQTFIKTLMIGMIALFDKFITCFKKYTSIFYLLMKINKNLYNFCLNPSKNLRIIKIITWKILKSQTGKE